MMETNYSTTANVPTTLTLIIDAIVRGKASSRAEVARRTGLARSTVSQQVDRLIRRGLLDEGADRPPGPGRPPRRLRVSRSAGTVCVVDVDTHRTQVVLASLTGDIIDQATVHERVDIGPQALLRLIVDCLNSLATEAGEDVSRIRQIVVGLPAPVDFQRGCAVRPPLMPGWDEYPLAGELSGSLSIPVMVDNDVNLAALGEATRQPSATPLLVIKIAVGIGAGFVNANGEIHRGADGAAGDIGHIRTGRHDEVTCWCGKTGCLEAVASFRAISDTLGISAQVGGSVADGIAMLRARAERGDPDALRALRTSTSEVGEVAAALIQMLNPRSLVLTGPLSLAHDEVLSGIRGIVYQRAVPLTTRDLIITTSQLGADGEILGGIELALRGAWDSTELHRFLR